MVAMLRQGQMEQIQSISDKFEQSFSRLTDMLTTVFQASGERKRRSGSAVTDTPPFKSVRLSHIDSEGDQHASLSTKARDFSDSASSNDEDAVSIPEENSLERDIAGLLEEEPKNEAVESEAASEAILDSIEAEWALTEDKGSEINTKLAKIANSLFSDKLHDEKIKEKLKKYPIPLNCSNLSVAKCNAEIWGTLPHAKKLQDISLQKNLNLISKAGGILANIGHHLLMWKAKETGEMPLNSLVNLTTDAIALLGHASQELHQLRRDSNKHNLPSNLKGLAHNIPPASELLYGDDLSKRIQNMKATNTALLKANYVGSKQLISRQYHGKAQIKHGSKNRFSSQRSSAPGKRSPYRRQGKQQQYQ